MDRRCLGDYDVPLDVWSEFFDIFLITVEKPQKNFNQKIEPIRDQVRQENGNISKSTLLNIMFLHRWEDFSWN